MHLGHFTAGTDDGAAINLEQRAGDMSFRKGIFEPQTRGKLHLAIGVQIPTLRRGGRRHFIARFDDAIQEIKRIGIHVHFDATQSQRRQPSVKDIDLGIDFRNACQRLGKTFADGDVGQMHVIGGQKLDGTDRQASGHHLGVFQGDEMTDLASGRIINRQAGEHQWHA